MFAKGKRNKLLIFFDFHSVRHKLVCHVIMVTLTETLCFRLNNVLDILSIRPPPSVSRITMLLAVEGKENKTLDQMVISYVLNIHVYKTYIVMHLTITKKNTFFICNISYSIKYKLSFRQNCCN